MLSIEEKQKIVAEVQKKIPQLSCPMCKNQKFILSDGYFNNVMQDDFDGFAIGGPAIPTIGLICENCGFISQHALGVLNLLPQKTENNESGKR